MKNKKVIITIVAVLLAIAAVVAAILLIPGPYEKDPEDTLELYNTNIASVGYENTVETAIPQIELYNVINEHFRSELPEGKTEKKAIIIGYDGCRADILAVKSEENSAISSLLKDGASINLTYCGGVNYPEVNTQDTSTAPGWCSILTGQWADVHGVTGNNIPKSMEAKTLMTTLTEDGIIDSASFITKWAGHFSRKNATYLPEVEYCTAHALPVTFNKCDNDEASHEAVMAEITAEECSDFIFVIYEPTDSTGHGKGFSFNNPDYKEAFRKGDAYGYDVIEEIKARESYENEDWLIIITSDHGGIETDHGKESIQERMTFVVMNKEFSKSDNAPAGEESASLSKTQAIKTFHEAYTVAKDWFDLFPAYVDDTYITEGDQVYQRVTHETINTIDKLKSFLSDYFSEKLIDSVISTSYKEIDGTLCFLSIEAGDFFPVYYFDLTEAEFLSESENKVAYNIIITSRYDEEIVGEETDFEKDTVKIKYVFENGNWVIDNYFGSYMYPTYEWSSK